MNCAKNALQMKSESPTESTLIDMNMVDIDGPFQWGGTVGNRKANRTHRN